MKAFIVNGEPHFEDPVDFPCSYSFRAYYRETMFGEILPPLEPKEPPQDVEVRHIYHHIDNTQRVMNRLDDLERPIKYLLEKDKQKEGKKGRYLG